MGIKNYAKIWNIMRSMQVFERARTHKNNKTNLPFALSVTDTPSAKQTCISLLLIHSTTKKHLLIQKQYTFTNKTCSQLFTFCANIRMFVWILRRSNVCLNNSNLHSTELLLNCKTKSWLDLRNSCGGSSRVESQINNNESCLDRMPENR